MMNPHLRIRLAAVVCSGLLSVAAVADAKNILIFHKQNGYIHTATPTVVTTLKNNWTANGLTVESTVDSLAFTAQNLARFDAVVFLNTNYRNGALLARAQESAFENYLRAGGAYVGLHSAIPLNGTWEETVWPWYATMYGARFRSHAPYRTGTLIVEDRTHYSTRHAPASILLPDEWYALQVNPRTVSGVHVLATVDETGFQADSYMGGDHPVVWSRAFEGGRTWVTVVGHDMGAFANESFLNLVRGGVEWAAGLDSSSTSIVPSRRVSRDRSNVTVLSYLGKNGQRREVHINGRSVTARPSQP
jgi:type 1 glutamine amidotransferase